MSNAIPAQFAGLSGALYGSEDERSPLVFLHGLAFDRRIWVPILDGLKQVDPDRRVLVLDLPGHGDSPSQLPHSFEHVNELLHSAIVAAGLDAPVLVGHSISGGLASIYAAKYPTSGAVNIDAPPDLAGFTTMLQTIADKIRGTEFHMIWEMLENGFRLDLLPTWARDFVKANCRPEQYVAISYWEHLLTTPPDQLTADLHADVRAVGALHIPYLLIAGDELSPAATEAMNLMPGAETEVWGDGGHFPHFAHPERFLDRLVATAGWRAGNRAIDSATRG